MRYDAVVIGGGPAGSTAALLLARAGWAVALVEQATFPRGKVCGEFLSATNIPLLKELGVWEEFLESAGPPVTRVGIFAGAGTVVADMPRLHTHGDSWGRAVSREFLDTMLLERAAAAGAAIFQPYSVIDLQGRDDDFSCAIASPGGRSSVTRLRTPVVIAAHGSWSRGTLPTLPAPSGPRRSDLFGFKARFRGSRLQRGLMPLLAFPGGYGGMVHTGGDRISLSCCIRRDELIRCRRLDPGASAGEAVFRHIVGHCHGACDALDGASLEIDGWRSAGPIRPGIRRSMPGVFLIGNAAGEAHPVVAEGISMAMQSAWLLTHRLTSGSAVEYGRDWRRAFTSRLRAAALIAHWAMRPSAVSLALPLLRAFPLVLTGGARSTGKVSVLCSPSC